jgi:hypothetical protein
MQPPSATHSSAPHNGCASTLRAGTGPTSGGMWWHAGAPDGQAGGRAMSVETRALPPDLNACLAVHCQLQPILCAPCAHAARCGEEGQCVADLLPGTVPSPSWWRGREEGAVRGRCCVQLWAAECPAPGALHLALCRRRRRHLRMHGSRRPRHTPLPLTTAVPQL